MIRIKYEGYRNDSCRKNEEKTFQDLGALADWIFNQMQQNYMNNSYLVMAFPTPERAKAIGKSGPWRIEFRPVYGGEDIWIHQIENSNGIIFSDCVFTSGLIHWSTEAKVWLTAYEKRRKAPKFNFVDEQAAESKWFAVTRWTAKDVIAAAEKQGVAMTQEQAEAWWAKNEICFQDMLVARGNGILSKMDFGGGEMR